MILQNFDAVCKKTSKIVSFVPISFREHLNKCKLMFSIAGEPIRRVAKFRENRRRDGGERVFRKTQRNCIMVVICYTEGDRNFYGVWRICVF